MKLVTIYVTRLTEGMTLETIRVDFPETPCDKYPVEFEDWNLSIEVVITDTENPERERTA